METKNNTIREFIETLLKLKRDSINFDYEFDVKIQTNNKIVKFTINKKTKQWNLYNGENTILNWSPKISEIYRLLMRFKVSDLKQSIDNYNIDFNNFINNKTAEILISALYRLKDYMVKNERIIPLSFNDLANNNVILIYDFNADSFFELSNRTFGSTIKINYDELLLILKNCSYIEISNELNNTYKI
jgi:hypothetical protein